MKKVIMILISLMFILVALFPITMAVEGDVQTYTEKITDAPGMDEMRGGYSGPGDFCWTHTFNPSNTYIFGAELTIRVYDIDYYDPHWEVVKIHVDGTYLDDLDNTGNNAWGETTFTLADLSVFDDGEVNVCVEFDDRENFLAEIDWSELEVEYQPHILVEKWNHGDEFVPVFTEIEFPMEIYVKNPNTDADDDLNNICVLDGIGAEFDLVLNYGADGVLGGGDDYIFMIDDTPITTYTGDTQKGMFTYMSNIVSWWQANENGKGQNKNKGCATNIMWEIETLVEDSSISLEFTIKTKSWTAGNSRNTKQSFTSTCWHTLNDGVFIYYDIDDDHYWIEGEPVTVSVYDPDPEADSDGDGYLDLDEVEIWGTDPCDDESHPIFVSGFNIDRNRGPLGYSGGGELDGEALADALLDLDNFGFGGTVPCLIVFLDFAQTIETESLVDGDGNLLCDLFFAGLTTTTLTTDEVDELKAFLEAGGILYLAGNSNPLEGASYNPLFTALGWSDIFTTTVSGVAGDWTSTPISTPITTGPFGTCGPLTSTPFTHISTITATIVATGVNPSYCIIAEASVGSNGGYLSMTGDPLYFDIFVDTGETYYDVDNLNYFLNLFALAE